MTSPSDPQEFLFRKLLDVTTRIQKALDCAEDEILSRLGEEHSQVMGELELLGFSQNPELIPLVKEVYDRVHELLPAMEERMDAVGRELSMVGKRKRQITAYSNAGRLPPA